MIENLFILAPGINMALDELRMLLNRLRRLVESEEPDEAKIGELREKIADLLSVSDVKVRIKCSFEREVRMDDFEEYDWVIDRFIDDPSLTQEDILADDIRDDLSYYVNFEDIYITIEREDGEELDSFR